MPFKTLLIAVWDLKHMVYKRSLQLNHCFQSCAVSVLAQTTRPSVDMHPFWHGHKCSCIPMSWNGKSSSMIIIGDNALSFHTLFVRQGVSRL